MEAKNGLTEPFPLTPFEVFRGPLYKNCLPLFEEKEKSINKFLQKGDNVKIENAIRNIFRDFPDEYIAYDIKKGKPRSPEAYRKMLIMLLFLEFANRNRTQNLCCVNSEERIMEIKRVIYKDLDMYGFSPIYECNPYDYTILHCLNSDRPLSTLKAILEHIMDW